MVNDNYEVEFTTMAESSACMNMAMPIQNRQNDTVYFEVKIHSFDRGTELAIGLTTMPHANWAMPGLLPYSMAITHLGQLVTNGRKDRVQILPRLARGDVVGIGKKFNSGTLFVSHNGRSVMEIARGVKFDMFVCVGSRGKASMSVNVGQSGFVLVEANIKHWGFCEAANEGSLGAPPAYGSAQHAVLDKGEELPPKYPEMGFFD